MVGAYHTEVSKRDTEMMTVGPEGNLEVKSSNVIILELLKAKFLKMMHKSVSNKEAVKGYQNLTTM